MLPSNFHTEIWYTPTPQRNSPNPLRLLLRTPTYKVMHTYSPILDGVLPVNLDKALFIFCVKDYANVDTATTLSATELHDLLPRDIVTDVLSFISTTYFPSQESMEKLALNVELLIDTKFDHTWDCSYCQRRKLDHQRNCPYLDKETYSPKFKMDVGGKNFLRCPIGSRDIDYSNAILDAYKLGELGLPEGGNLGDQTLFFVEAYTLVKSRIQYYQNKSKE